MITEFGKYLRKLRIDHTITLRKMADAIGVSPSALSSAETGKRNITPSMLVNIASYFSLTTEQVNELNQLAEISQKEISVPLHGATFEQRNSAVAFARKLNSLSMDDLKRIDDILED